MKPIEYFQRLATATEIKLQTLQKRLTTISLFRLAVFVLAAVAIYFLWIYKVAVVLALLIALSIFVILVKYYTEAKNKKEFEQAMLKLSHEELEVLKGKWTARKEGAGYEDAGHAYSKDLTIFGKHSLFQYLNRCQSELATLYFANMLKVGLTDTNELFREREFIAEMSSKPEFNMQLLAHANFSKSTYALLQRLESWSCESEVTHSRLFWFLVTVLLPIFSFTTVFLYATDVIAGKTVLFCFLLPAAFIGFFMKNHQHRFSRLIAILGQIEALEAMLSLIRTEKWNSMKAIELLQNAAFDEKMSGLKQLRKIVGAIDSRNNIVVAIALNLLLLWDFQCMKRLVDWKIQFGKALPAWFHLAHVFESYTCFALYVFEHPMATYPDFIENGFLIEEGLHPLMSKNAVPNNLDLTAGLRFSIITGANMAGKSTYLRMVGINLLLAMRGLPVLARSLQFKPTPIFTSMLSADSLGDDESYFFNELKRLRQMADILESGEARFVILDEILKGTNSVDKAQGSRRFMEKLLQLPAHGLIATHDLSLCKLKDAFPVEVENTKFEVRFEHDELAFDYKLEKGVCQNMNASFLLQKMGLSD